MHKRKIAEVQDPISPNLIPMIDIMFLLLLFFMLGADMAARETETMVLANTDKATEIDPNVDEKEPETNINIHHSGSFSCAVYDNKGFCREKTHWAWSISGLSYNKDTIQPKLKELADLSLDDHVDPDAKKVLSRRKVMIRADRAAPYGDVQKVIEYCGLAGLYKIAVVGALPLPE